MDQKKIRDFVKQAHPTREIVDDEGDRRITAEADAKDVDVGDVSLGTWRKFGTPPGKKPMSAQDDLRERFRPRKLTGAGPQTGAKADADPVKPSERQSGKLALKRTVKKGEAADTEDSLDVLVDEDEGIIGESDSGPDKD